MTGMSKSITGPQKVAPINLETHEDQVKKRNISSQQEGFDPHIATGACSLLYCSTATLLSSIPDCLPAGNAVLVAPSMQSEVFINQVIGDIYTYDQVNRLFICMANMDQDTAAYLRQFLKEKDQKWLKVTTPSWAYLTPTNSPMLCIE